MVNVDYERFKIELTIAPEKRMKEREQKQKNKNKISRGVSCVWFISM